MMKNYFRFVGSLLVLFTLCVFPLGVRAETDASVDARIEILQNQIRLLLAQIRELKASQATAFCYSFDRDVTFGSAPQDLVALNKVLSLQGISSINESVFTEETAAGVVALQAKLGVRQTGYVGPLTRARLNRLYACVSTPSAIPILTLTSPNGGEIVKRIDGRATLLTTWTTVGIPSTATLNTVRLRALENGVEFNLASNIMNDGSETFDIPVSIPDGAYTLEIKGVYQGITFVGKSSSYFKIISTPTTGAFLKVHSPNGGETFQAGQNMFITFSSTGFKESDLIDILIDNVETHESSFLTRVAAQNRSNQLVPVFLPTDLKSGSQYKISISTTVCQVENSSCVFDDSSDQPFTITTSQSASQPAYPGFFISVDKSLYRHGETALVTISRADGSSAPYDVDVYISDTSANRVKARVASSVRISQTGTVKIPINSSEQPLFIRSDVPKEYLIITCGAGQSCSNGTNSNFITVAPSVLGVQRRTSEVIIPGTIGGTALVSSDGTRKTCEIGRGTCDSYTARYRSSQGRDIEVDVEYVTESQQFSVDTFKKSLVALLGGTISTKSFTGNITELNSFQPVNIRTQNAAYAFTSSQDSDSVLFIWPFRDGVVAVNTEPWDGADGPLALDTLKILEAYISRYPTLLSTQ